MQEIVVLVAIGIAFALVGATVIDHMRTTYLSRRIVDILAEKVKLEGGSTLREVLKSLEKNACAMNSRNPAKAAGIFCAVNTIRSTMEIHEKQINEMII
ncbi:unnamed protein product [marine sediment metagenome]|uniref:Uncharacterized protein n=1 Tax=marine sediment metagenome TaxID=412755 RepID=X0S4T1_9ZZZZ